MRKEAGAHEMSVSDTRSCLKKRRKDAAATPIVVLQQPNKRRCESEQHSRFDTYSTGNVYWVFGGAAIRFGRQGKRGVKPLLDKRKFGPPVSGTGGRLQLVTEIQKYWLGECLLKIQAVTFTIGNKCLPNTVCCH